MPFSASMRLNTYSRLASSYAAVGRAADAVRALGEFGRRYGTDPGMAPELAKVREQLSQTCRGADVRGLPECREAL
jgi:hypothetical protein